MSFKEYQINKIFSDSLEKYYQSIADKYPEDSFDEDYEYNEDEDVVNKPKHYMLFPEYNIEVRDLCRRMAEKISDSGYSAFFVSDYVQMLQYILRFQDKNGKEDLSKSEYYLKKLINDYDKE